MGGDESEDAAAQAKAAADKAAADAKAAAEAQRGYPANTRVEDMTDAQQAAYWKHHARKHQDRASAFGNMTAEQLAELQAKAKELDDAKAKEGTATEQAVRAARAEAEHQAAATYRPLLVRAEFRAAVGDRLTAAELEAALAPMGDLSFFLAADGTPDVAKITDYAGKNLAPAQKEKPRGPSSAGAGGGPPSGGGAGGTVEERAARRAERLGIKQPAKQ